MTSPIDIEALKAERREELIKLIDYHARITVGDYGLSAELDNADEIADAILASEDSLIARTEAAEGEVEHWKGLADEHALFDAETDLAFKDLDAQIADQAETIAELVAQRDGLVEIAKELADEVEGDVNARYDGTKDHPAMKRRYERDMEPVARARALLDTIKAGGGADE